MKLAKGLFALAVLAALSLPMAAQNGGWHIPDRDNRDNRDNGTWRDDRDDDRWHRDSDHDRDRNGDWRRDRDSDRGWGGWNRDGWNRGRYSEMAFRNGYYAGLHDGQRDRDRNKKFKYGKAYKRGNSGYRSEFGDKNRYRYEFQRGYADGYRRGYSHWNARNGGGGWHIPRR